MTKPLHQILPAAVDRSRSGEGLSTAAPTYAELCLVPNLQLAYDQLQEHCQEPAIDPEGVPSFLQQLSSDLKAQTYRPGLFDQPSPTTRGAKSHQELALGDLVVQVALRRLLESSFPPAFPCDPRSETAIQWIAGNIEKGLGRVYAMNLNPSGEATPPEQLLEGVRHWVEDPQLIGLLKDVLATPLPPGLPPHGRLAPVLADIALQGIDQLLQQARTLGREGNVHHVQCMRQGNQVLVLVDGDPRYDWVLPAVQQRLREELTELHWDMAAIETQSVDLSLGGPLRFLGYKLRLVKGKRGAAQVQYQPFQEAGSQPERLQPNLAPPERSQPLPLLPRCWAGMKRLFSRWHVPDAVRKVNAIQVSWHHLPITLYPIIAFLAGWRSLAAWLCLALIVICNAKWVLGLLRSLGRWAWRRKLDVVMGACALTALIFLAIQVSDLNANRSREDAVPSLPPGFYRGQYNKDAPWGAELVHYGLYIPPHFQGQKGPFPLIVFLHGAGEKNKTLIFKAGLPHAIANRFGPDSPNGRFEFVAFFPNSPKGPWSPDIPEVQDALLVLDYVIERHRIDPARVYLTGHSSGGIGVWNLAEAYPNKWAAVAPVASFISPDIERVRHIPAWIFHGASDRSAPVQRERQLVRQLKEAGADVRYTEFSNKEHRIWHEVYDPKELYEWLATKKKD